MHTTEWDRDLLRATLQEIMNRADLTQAAVGELAGRDRTMANRWLSGRHQPNYEAASRFTAALRAQRLDLGDLLDRFMRAAGYETHTQVAGQTAHLALDALREQARTSKQSLGELLVREGLADPKELIIPDVLPPDKSMEEIMTLDIPDETKANLLRLHLENRAYRAEEERLKGKKPDGA